MIKNRLKKVLSYFLALTLVLQLIPAQALATTLLDSELLTLENQDSVAVAEDSTATIVAEIPEGRDKFQKEFLLSNGMRMISIYGSAVHYEEDGQWKEIDNTLQPISSTGAVLTSTEAIISAAAYKNTAGMWDVKLPASLDAAKAVEVSRDGYTLSFQFAGEIHNNHVVMGLEDELSTATFDVTESLAANVQDITANMGASVTQISTANAVILEPSALAEGSPQQSQPDKLYSALQYSDIYANTDLRYDLQSNQLKESVIIKSAKDTLAGYKYILSAPNMVLELQDDNSIHVYAANAAEGDEPLFYMPAPFLRDDNRVHNDDITVSLQRSGDTYTLTYSLPRAWLQEEDRAYPVVLDPVIRPESGIYTISDQTVWSDATTSYTWGCVAVGYTPSQGKARTLIKFRELPELTSADVIVGATLSLCLVEYDTAVTMEAHQVLTEWESHSVTWSDVDEADVEWNSVVEDYQIITDPTWYTWDITNIAQGWYADGYNSGVFFKASDVYENITTHETREFYSSDWGGSVTPVLHIMYLNNSGLEPYWDYTSQSAGRAGTGHVNNFTGNLVWVHNGLSFSGNRMPVSLSHIYSANDSSSNEFGLGYGWRTNYNQRIYQWTSPGDDPTTYYVWEDADGTKHYFTHDEGNVYKDEIVNTRTITIGGSGDQTYALDDGSGNISYFDNHSGKGRLKRIVNNQETPSIITITYCSDAPYQISTITDGAGVTNVAAKTATGGRKYVFTYTNNLLSEIAFHGTKTAAEIEAANEEDAIPSLQYGYTNSNLTTITYPLVDGEMTGRTVTFGYAEDHLLSSATDSDGYQVLYTYYSDNADVIRRIKTIQEKDTGANLSGGSLNIEYAHNQTTFSDRKGNVEIHQYNNFGSTVSIQDDQGRAQFAQYVSEEDIKSASQLSLSSKLQSTTVNLLPDGGFEQDLSGWTADDAGFGDNIYVDIEASFLDGGALVIDSRITGVDVMITPKEAYLPVLQPGHTYTLSGYISSSFGPLSDAHILLAVAGYSTIEAEECLYADDECIQVSLTYTHPGNAEPATARCVLVHHGRGTTFFDNVQLIESTTPTRYNLITNEDFRFGTSGWTANSSCTTDDTVSTVPSSAAPQLDASAYKIEGSATASKKVSQTITLSGSKDDVFTLGGWGKGDSVPLSGNRKFGISVEFIDSDGTAGTEHLVSFNPDCDSANNWQYVARRVVADQDYSSIRVNLLYCLNQNVAYFDGIQLYKEEFGQSYTYDSEGNVESVVDLQQQTTSYEYDENNNLLSIATGTDSNKKIINSYEYDDYNNVTKAVSEEGVITEFEYDTYGNNTRVTVTDGVKTLTTSAQFTGYSNASPQPLDGNQLVSMTDALGYTTAYLYNDQTGVLTSSQSPGNVPATVYSYDGLWRSNGVSQGDTSVLYDYNGDLLSKITSASETKYYFTYGAFNLLESIHIGSDPLITHTYSSSPNFYLTKSTYANDDSISYNYDDLGRITSKTYEDGASISYVYDSNGNLGLMTDSATGRTTKYSYDFLDRLMRYVETGTDYSNSVSWTYDEKNNLTSQKQTINGTTYTTSYSYDDDNNLSGSTQGNTTSSYTYDGFGRIGAIIGTHKIGSDTSAIVTSNIAYIDVGTSGTSSQVDTWENITPAGTTKYTYTYDSRGNITSISNNVTNTTTRYRYDSLNQLIREDNQEAGTTWSYTYFKGGNIQSKTEYSYTTGDLGPALKTIFYNYDTGSWKDSLSNLRDENNAILDTFQYDEIGNLEEDSDYSYVWEHGRQLKEINSQSEQLTFAYDSDGYRIKKTHLDSDNVETVTEYSYSGGQLSHMTVACGSTTHTLHFIYDILGPAAVDYNGTRYYYTRNAQGDIIGIIDIEGTKMADYAYDAWGNPLSLPNAATSTLGELNPFRYRNYVYDSETSLYYLISRYYNPSLGRFINADAVLLTDDLLGNNQYAYCCNNPVTYDDPTGHGLDIVFDFISLGFSIKDVIDDPSNPYAWAALGLDVLCLAVPIMSGGGTLVRGLSKVDDVVDLAKAVDKGKDLVNVIDAVGDTARAVDGLGDAAKVTDTLTDITKGLDLSGGLCFIAGTPVLTNDGLTAIEEIEVGDIVWASNPETGEVALKPVVQTFVNETQELVHIHVNGERITCTPEHPFYSPVLGWTNAIQLRAGDILVTVNGEYVIVEQVQHELLESPIKVYNFEVEGFHTYYVGTSSVLVHNACDLSVPVTDLIPTHGLTRSRREMASLIDDISVNGIKDPIKYVTYNGQKYIVDGHHRLAAAKRLKMPFVPAIEVALPYAGYKSYIDLFF